MVQRAATSDTLSPAEAAQGHGEARPSGGDGLRHAETEFLTQLGGRVRQMRTLREMSRRELSRKSGVSERYIAQIEAGKGNVSIMLLLRIAHAIRCA